MSESTLNIVVDFSDKSATFTGIPAVGETVLLHITNVPSDVTSSELTFVITDYGDNRLAVCETFTGIAGTFEGEINLNTIQLLKEFKGLSTRVKKRYPCALWRNSTYNDLIFNDKVSILSNPYPGTGTPVDVSTEFVSFTGTHPADGEFAAFSGTSGTQVKKSGYSASSFATPDASSITSGTLDGDRLPAMSTSKKGAVPATGSPAQKYLRDDGTWAYPPVSGDSAFTDLTDVPSSYTGQSGKKVAVKATEDGLEFVADSSTVWGAIAGTLSNQTDLQSALDAKASASTLSSHTGNTSNPHSVTASQIGLGNVQNVDQTNASNISSGTLNAARLPASGVTAGSYTSTNLTVDDYGRITAVSNGSGGGSMSGYPAAEDLTNADSGKILSAYLGGDTSLLLCHFDNNFIDNSASNRTATNSGVTFSNSIYKFGNYSAVFDGASYVTFPNSSDFNFGASNFSIATQVYPTSLDSSGKVVVSCWSDVSNQRGWMIQVLTSSIRFYYSTTGSDYPYVEFSTSLPTSTWSHVEISRTGNTIYCFVNGTLVSSASFTSTIYSSSAVLMIGAVTGGSGQERYFEGNLDEIKIANSGGHTSSFTAPTTAYSDTAKLFQLVQPDISRCQGRLTLESGVPVSSSNQTAKTTLYFTPYKGNQVALYNGSAWILRSFTETSLSLSGYTADTNYDIWAYDNAGILALASTAWTNATTRATALTLQNGIYVKSGDATHRYLGTIRTTATTGQTEDSQTKRFVWNYYNQQERHCTQPITYLTYSYSTTSWRVAAGDSSKGLFFVCGLATVVSPAVEITCKVSSGGYMYVGIMKNGSNYYSQRMDFTSWFTSFMAAPTQLAAGYNYIHVGELIGSGTETGNEWGLWGTIKN